jgi:23S rRNA (uracil1939-C5)-methyltransferase
VDEVVCYTHSIAKIIVKTGKLTNTGASIAVFDAKSGVNEDQVGKKVFVQGALPEETVEIEVLHEKSKFVDAVVTKVLEPSPIRVAPKDPDTYLATSPWQVLPIEEEEKVKKALIVEAFRLGGIDLLKEPKFNSSPAQWEYRNKYTYTFTGTGYQFAAIERKTNTPIASTSFSLPSNFITQQANAILNSLEETGVIKPQDLHSLLVRNNKAGETLSRIYVKTTKLNIDDANVLLDNLKKRGASHNLEIYFFDQMNPREHSALFGFGESVLKDVLSVNNNAQEFEYAIDSFFQVNTPVYEQALQVIAEKIIGEKNVVDMYSGIGSIGLSVSSEDVKSLKLVEIDSNSTKYAEINAQHWLDMSSEQDIDVEVITSDAKKALDFIIHDSTLILDPPRAGLDKNITNRINLEQPKQIVYLSCNPATLARDISRISDYYVIKHIEGFNFFPKTPHTEVLVVLSHI